jgi:hypothetical protein
MAEAGSTAQAGSTTTATDAGNSTAQQTGGSQAAAGSRTFTQEEVNSLLAKERRDTQAKYPDYEDLKAKAAKLDELEEANRSDLEKAQAEAAKYKAKAEKYEADAKRAEDVAEMAGKYGVDAALLARMDGDVEDNAKFLKERGDAQQKYPSTYDGGSQGGGSGGVTAEDIKNAKSARERVRLRAQMNAQDRKRG